MFSSADLAILDAAFAEAWSVLSDPKFSRPWAYNRDEVARQVIYEAVQGERDQQRLASLVITQFLKV